MASQRKAGAVLGYVNIIVKNLVNLVYTPLLLSFVGQADYGVFQTASSFVFSLSLLSFGFSEAYVRFYTQKQANGTEHDIRALNGMYLILYAIVSLAALVLGLVFAGNVELFFSGQFTPDQVDLAGELMAIMAFNVALTLFSTVFDAYILAHEQFTFQQTRQIITTLASPLFAVILLFAGLGAVGVAIAQLLVVVILLGLNLKYSIRNLGMRFDFGTFDGVLFRAIAAFSAWIFSNQVCELINQSVPNIILGALSGAIAVSVFAVAIQIRQVFYSLSTTISSVFVPLINRIVAESDDNHELTNLMTNVGRYQAMLFLYVLGGFVVLGRFFITTWAGQGFEDAYFLVIVMVAPLIIPLTQNTGIEIQRAKNRHRARSVAYLVMAAVNLLITAALSPALGFWAPAIGYLAYVILGCGVFMNWYYQARIGLDMFHFWRHILPLVFAAALVTALCLLGTAVFPVSNLIAFLVWGAVYSVFFIGVFVLRMMNDDERSTILGFIKRG